MVQSHHDDDAEKEQLTESDAEKGDPTGGHTGGEKARPTGGEEVGSAGREAPNDRFNRRSVLKLTGTAATAGLAGALTAVTPARAERDVSSGDGFEIWTVTGKEVYDLSDGEELSNVLVDQTADGACLTIRSRNRTDWTVRNVGFLGVGEAGSGGNRFQLQVSTPSGGNATIENVWANGKARDGQPASELGGIYIRSSHAGHIDIRHTYIEGFGNNAVYASAVGKDGGGDGSVTLENCYHRDNTVSQFRIGSPDSVVRNCVGVLDDPDGERGRYPGDGTYNARGVWGKHFRDQRVENCSFYISDADRNWDGIFESRYIEDRSHGPEAVVEVVDCNVNADAPSLTGSTANATVNLTNLGENPTVSVIQNGGVPTSPEMAARGQREMPPELPGASGSTGGSSTTLERTLTVDGSDAGWTDYAFSVSGDLAENADAGAQGPGDTIDGSSASGFVNGGSDGFYFSGEVVDISVDGDADILVDGQVVDPSTLGDPDPGVSTAGASDLSQSAATLQGSLDSLGEADTADVAFEWRPADASTWERTDSATLSSTGSFSRELSGLSADTVYEYRSVVAASDGDTATGSTVEFSTAPAQTLERTLTVDGSDAGWTDYAFSVSGDLAENADAGAQGPGDTIDGSSASGFVNGGSDGFYFSGEVVDISVDGDADILVDGQVVDVGSVALPNSIVFDGRDTSSQTTYSVEVSGDLVNDTALGQIESGDVIDGSSVTGTVTGDDVDGFRFSGNLLGLQLDGQASVTFEDNDG